MCPIYYHFPLIRSLEVGTIIYPVLQIRKLHVREVTSKVPGPRVVETQF